MREPECEANTQCSCVLQALELLARVGIASSGWTFAHLPLGVALEMHLWNGEQHEDSNATSLRLALWVLPLALGGFCSWCGHSYTEACLQRLVVSIRAAPATYLQWCGGTETAIAGQKPELRYVQPAPSSGTLSPWSFNTSWSWAGFQNLFYTHNMVWRDSDMSQV